MTVRNRGGFPFETCRERPGWWRWSRAARDGCGDLDRTVGLLERAMFDLMKNRDNCVVLKRTRLLKKTKR